MTQEEGFWKSFCGHHDNIQPWYHGDIGHCFEHVAIVLPIHTILAAVTVFHIAQTRRTSVYDGAYLPCHVRLRLLVTLCLAITPGAQVLLIYYINNSKPCALDVLNICVLTVCWLLQSVYVYRLKFMFWISYRGPTVNIAVYLSLLMSVCFEVYSSIIFVLQRRYLIESYCLFITFGLHLLYVLTLTCKGHRVHYSGLLQNAINVSPSETETLVRHYDSYGSVGVQAGQLSYAEDGSPCLSRLTFYWVLKLMVKGRNQRISSSDDIFLLPDRLNTQKVTSLFSMCLETKQNTCNEMLSGSSESQPYVQIHRRRHKHLLLSALYQAFGKEYFSLGILKLLADAAGFAGPILLNLLVSFIEEKTEPMYYGYVYASCLLFSTFIGSILSTQFDYNVKVVSFKIRAAIITTIYKKSLSVSSVSASEFSSGEIVNFMSTDTDRITNFCPSFHAVWSLPFQIVVALVLLYKQIGVASLAGLGFALVLIPINRWIANKIGELSQEMMTQKDNRVKVYVVPGLSQTIFYSFKILFCLCIIYRYMKQFWRKERHYNLQIIHMWFQ